MTARLKTCLDAGSSQALFPMLSKWPSAELEALLTDLESYCAEMQEKVEAHFKKHAFRPENFLNEQRSRALDAACQSAQIHILAACSEIASVAMLYLDVQSTNPPN